MGAQPTKNPSSGDEMERFFASSGTAGQPLGNQLPTLYRGFQNVLLPRDSPYGGYPKAIVPGSQRRFQPLGHGGLWVIQGNFDLTAVAFHSIILNCTSSPNGVDPSCRTIPSSNLRKTSSIYSLAPERYKICPIARCRARRRGDGGSIPWFAVRYSALVTGNILYPIP